VYGDTYSIEYFKALVCGERLPNDEDGDDEDGDEGGDDYSIAAKCYFRNYQRFAEDKLKIIPPEANLQIAEFEWNGVPYCKMIGEEEDANGVEDVGVPCECSDPEIMKNMYNKDVCEEAKILAANPDEGMNQAGLDNFESLVCEVPENQESGIQTNFLSFGIILLCTLFKF